ncbi:MAG TPA: DUF835 domain-containing protein [Thermoplasmata archaeon]|nr:DUF835 domain-containing protein [Thermoplasmata archaeon]
MSALFLSGLIVIAIARQKTLRVFQKNVLLFSTFLLICAVISNVLISIYITEPSQAGNQTALEEGIVLTKRVQATFDYLFGISIGAFIVVATTPGINSRRDFLRYITDEFPNSYVFYVFIMAITIITILVSPVTVISTRPTVISFEPYFLFINGLAVATLILYAPYRFIMHMRRTNPGREVRRDTYLIILGISGFAIGELLFEILLPSYFGIDLRAPGFIVEMALVGLIAYGIREKSFLQDLMVPEAEAHLASEPSFALDRGYTYAILERDANRAFEIFKDLVTHGAQGLCITRRSPKAVMSAYGLERTPILWLSRVATDKNAVRPSPPERVAMAVEHFIEVSENSVVLLDGFEYLVAHNDFGSILALLHDLNESIAMRDAILLAPFDPTAFVEREIALIRREVRLLGPMAGDIGEMAKLSP